MPERGGTRAAQRVARAHTGENIARDSTCLERRFIMVSKYSNVMKFYMYLATNDVSYTATELRQYHERQHELITLDSRSFYIKHSRRSQSDKQLAIWYYTRGVRYHTRQTETHITLRDSKRYWRRKHMRREQEQDKPINRIQTCAGNGQREQGGNCQDCPSCLLTEGSWS